MKIGGIRDMTEAEIIEGFNRELYSDLPPAPPSLPLLAHYTSLETLEQILKNQEVWFSNPLLMNDLEEVRFGILNGARILSESHELADALGGNDRRTRFYQALEHYQKHYEQEFLLDTYVFCLSEHLRGDRDGLLSMWRGYGGNGRGAAIVFDPSRLGPEIGASALVYAPVQYGSPEDRLAWIEKLAVRVAGLARQSGLPDDKVYLAAHATFERLKLFALFSKHRGFAEEREWRIVYLPERDGGKKLRPRFNYLNGARGVEPKLRFKVEPIDGLTPPDLSLDKLIDSILLGPSTSSPLAHRSVERMLEVIGMPQLKDRLFASTIPFRAL